MTSSSTASLVNPDELRALYAQLGAQGARLSRALDVLLSLRQDAQHPQVSVEGVRYALARHGWRAVTGTAGQAEVWARAWHGFVQLPDGVSRDSALRLSEVATALAQSAERGTVWARAELIDASGQQVRCGDLGPYPARLSPEPGPLAPRFGRAIAEQMAADLALAYHAAGSDTWTLMEFRHEQLVIKHWVWDEAEGHGRVEVAELVDPDAECLYAIGAHWPWTREPDEHSA